MEKAITVLAKLTATEQLALRDGLSASFPGVNCFGASEENGRIALVPPRLGGADEYVESWRRRASPKRM